MTEEKQCTIVCLGIYGYPVPLFGNSLGGALCLNTMIPPCTKPGHERHSSQFGVEELNWPAQSPELNTLKTLSLNLTRAEWEIPPSSYQNLVESPSR